ncbi:hypothetical protein AVEN_256605-1 [Araneus ventricosus]|uniref:Uncharacterized protein n=1 Tax=Araneus ventricosus TaxID=182803 RepID=A0A4Y2UBD4_ARAVE|nr:hypothetical protein AVEN_256605-1 [Araneus ventricosus]
MSKEEDDDLRSGASDYPNAFSMESESSNANGRASPMRITQTPPTCLTCAIQAQHNRYLSSLDAEVRGKREALQQYAGVTLYSPEEEAHVFKLREEERILSEQFSTALGKNETLDI